MSMLSIETVEQCIKELVQKFKENPNFFTSESDVKCYLYHLLISKEIFRGNFLTKDKKSTGLVHTEYPSFKKPFVDLVILDHRNVAQYRLKRQRVMCAVEIKFCSIAHFNVEEREVRERLRADKQAYKFFIYLFKKPSGWQDFMDELLKNKEENEELLESTAQQVLVTRMRPEIS